MSSDMEEEFLLYTATNSFEADQIMVMLKSNGVPSYKREHGAGQYLSIVFGVNTTQAIDIIIPSQAKEKAEELLAVMGLQQEEDA